MQARAGQADCQAGEVRRDALSASQPKQHQEPPELLPSSKRIWWYPQQTLAETSLPVSSGQDWVDGVRIEASDTLGHVGLSRGTRGAIEGQSIEGHTRAESTSKSTHAVTGVATNGEGCQWPINGGVRLGLSLAPATAAPQQPGNQDERDMRQWVKGDGAIRDPKYSSIDVKLGSSADSPTARRQLLTKPTLCPRCTHALSTSNSRPPTACCVVTT